MYSGSLLLLAAIGVVSWLRGLLEWQRHRSTLLAFCLAAFAAVLIETLLAGAGRWLGPGDALRDLYALPLLIGIFSVPLTLFAFATASRRLGFAWARLDWGHGGACLFATALLLYNLREVLALKQIFPACWQDVVWYLRAVPEGLACAGIPPPGTRPGFPVVLAVVLAAWAGLGAGLWWRRREPWLALAMAAGVALALVPWEFGPLPGLSGRLLCFGAIARAAARHATAPAAEPG